jgi:hypothetical protein
MWRRLSVPEVLNLNAILSLEELLQGRPGRLPDRKPIMHRWSLGIPDRPENVWTISFIPARRQFLPAESASSRSNLNIVEADSGELLSRMTVAQA